VGSSSAVSLASLRNDVPHAPRLSRRVHVDLPFFRPVGHVSREGRDPHAPARLGEIDAEQFAPARLAGGLVDELVRPAAAVLRYRHHAPLRRERHAAALQFLSRQRFRLAARDRHRSVRVVAAQREEHDARHQRDRPGGAPRQAEHRRHLLGGAHPDLGDALRRRRRLPCAVEQRRRQLGPCASLHPPPQHDQSGTSVSATTMNCWNQMPGAFARKMGWRTRRRRR
jgi:hypothetical protein